MDGIVLIAAGASTRLGQPKQNLEFQGQTLLERAIAAASSAALGPVVVVTGANASVLSSFPSIPSLHEAHNPAWATGMGSSIRAGLQALLKLAPDITGVVIMLCDQPFVTASLLQSMVQTQRSTQNGIVACAYQNTLGAPVYFTSPYFPEILQLHGQEGAKKIIARHLPEVARFPFPKGAIDIDTLQDYLALLS